MKERRPEIQEIKIKKHPERLEKDWEKKPVRNPAPLRLSACPRFEKQKKGKEKSKEKKRPNQLRSGAYHRKPSEVEAGGRMTRISKSFGKRKGHNEPKRED